MNYILTILRRRKPEDAPYWEDFAYEAVTEADTVATALKAINERTVLCNAGGEVSQRIRWECSCLQKKCGACAMVINGRPSLACDRQLKEFADGRVRLEPLRKFPVVSDLICDRSILYENLKTLKLWLPEDAGLDDRDQDLAYEASQCIQCGCCLDVCPNFMPGGKFTGMAAVPLTTRLLTELPASEAKEIARRYLKHTFDGCGKSLACKNVCPRKIDTEKMLVNSNALAIWKKKRR